MISVWVDKNKIIIQTDDPSIKHFLEVCKKTWEYIPYQKKYGYATKIIKIYDKKTTKNGLITFTLGLGWAGYVANTLSAYISGDDYNCLLRSIISDEYRTDPFPELRDYQNEDILHMLKFKVGLCGVYTSYGKQNCRTM